MTWTKACELPALDLSHVLNSAIRRHPEGRDRLTAWAAIVEAAAGMDRELRDAKRAEAWGQIYGSREFRSVPAPPPRERVPGEDDEP